MEGRRNGALISIDQGKAVAFSIFNLQARGEMFVTHNDPVYTGMIVGLAPKPGDMIINVMKGKKLTNMRTQGTDENIVLTPVRQMSIAEQLSILSCSAIDIFLTGVSTTFSSVPWVLIFVNFFPFITLIIISPGFGAKPTIMPSYTGSL